MLDCTSGGQGRTCRQAMRGPPWRMGAGQEWGFVRAGSVGRHGDTGGGRGQDGVTGCGGDTGTLGEEGDRGQAHSRCRC